MQRQKTLAETVCCSGRGLHSGAQVRLTLQPAPAGSGVVFVRTDLGGREILAQPSSVKSIYRATTLGRGGDRVSTVEHLLAALYALAVDNVRVELDGPEVPVLDGSAAPFVEILQSAGLTEQSAPRARLRVLKAFELVDGKCRIAIAPACDLEIRYAIDFEHPVIRRQELHLGPLTAACFEREIAWARTFGFLDEVAALREAGLALGGDLDNTVVLSDDRVITPDGTRSPDEFVRHKVLDLLGDLALLGARLEGAIEVERGGHSMHQRLVQALLTRPGVAEWIGVPARSPAAVAAEPVAAAAR